MLGKCLVLFTILCVVNGHVIINVYDDKNNDIQQDLESSVQTCDLSGCDQSCRALGYKRGVCFRDECLCQHFQETTADGEQALVLSKPVQSCNPSWCEQSCQRMGFPGGACVGDRCKCDIIQDTRIESQLQDCKDWCNQACQAFGYIGGKCYNGKCYCRRGDTFQKYSGDKLEIMRSDSNSSVQGCNDWCNDFCKAVGFHGGTCNGETCNCSTKEKQLDALATSEDNCNISHCSTKCSLEGFTFALCSNNKCYCLNYQQDGALEASAPGQVCASSSCNHVCRELNYSRGTCHGDTCKCHKQHSVHSKGVVHHESTDASVGWICNEYWCDSNCKMRGYVSGTCIAGSCHCRWYRPKEGVGHHQPTEASVDKMCSQLECNQGCVQMGYARGSCVGNDCKCSSFAKEETTENDVSKEVSEEDTFPMNRF
ncbi:hypothetical protein NE865_04405 [Phthorimaea operculella]|nr:hypothetical protein NE865_04405 [Phthorimaea operculella]